ncbi:hypothetical protein RUND412_003698 [Rhizina undulata]
MNLCDVSSLTRAQRNVVHFVLEDRNRRTGGHGRWALVGLKWGSEDLEDLEISIIFCEYNAPADPHFEFGKRFYLSTGKGDVPGGKVKETDSSGAEELSGSVVDKGKHVLGRGYGDRGRQGVNYPHARSPGTANPSIDAMKLYESENIPLTAKDFPSLKDTAPIYGEKDPWPYLPPKFADWEKDPWKQETQRFAAPSSRGWGPAAVTQVESDDVWNFPVEGSTSEIRRHKPSDKTIEAISSSDSPGSSSSRFGTNPRTGGKSGTPSVASNIAKEQETSHVTTQAPKQRGSQLSRTQIGNLHDLACELRTKGEIEQAILLFSVVWYCRDMLMGAFHPKTLKTMEELATAFEKTGETKLTVMLRKALRSRRQNNPQINRGASALENAAGFAPAPTVADLYKLHKWGVEMRLQRDPGKSIWLLSSVWYVRNILEGEGHFATRSAISELIFSYDANGQPDMANKLREEMVKISRLKGSR